MNFFYCHGNTTYNIFKFRSDRTLMFINDYTCSNQSPEVNFEANQITEDFENNETVPILKMYLVLYDENRVERLKIIPIICVDIN